MDIHKIIIFPDLAKLPKSDLKDMAADLSLDDSGTAFDLSKRVWESLTSESQQKEIYTKYNNKLLAGRTSVSWFTCDNIGELVNSIVEKEKVNPFIERIPYDIEEIDSTPKLRSAARIDDNRYYLRFIYRDGTRRILGEDIKILPTTNTATVYIDENKGIIEIRTRPNEAQKIAEVIAGYLKQQLSLNKEDFIKPFGYDLEKLADKLDGALSESKASPEMWLDSYAVSENEAILEILNAIDDYFETKEIGNLQEKLDSSIAVLGEELTEIPFIAIILAGMGNVGLKVMEDDLRSTAFYQLLKPYLQTSGGNIQFNVEINGLEKQYTIQVGVDTKTIYFRSNTTTEEVIEYVRERIIK